MDASAGSQLDSTQGGTGTASAMSLTAKKKSATVSPLSDEERVCIRFRLVQYALWLG